MRGVRQGSGRDETGVRQALVLTGFGGVWVGRVGEFPELRRLKLLPDGVQQLVEGHFHRGLQVTRVDQLPGQRSGVSVGSQHSIVGQ